MPEKPMMKCGHRANGWGHRGGNDLIPICEDCSGDTILAYEPEPERTWVLDELVEAIWPEGPEGPAVVRRWPPDDAGAATMDPLNVGDIHEPYSPSPYEFTSESSFLSKGRGRVWAIDASQRPYEMHDPNDLRGLVVSLNGALVRIRGVETYAIMRGPQRPYSLSFGLLVDDPDA